MLWIAIPLGLIVGFVGAGLIPRRPRYHAMVAFRHAERSFGSPFRDLEATKTLGEVVELVRVGGLDPRVCPGGFDLVAGEGTLTVRVADAATVRLADLKIVYGGADLVIELALALAVAYGPIVVTEMLGQYVVEGTLDANQLREAEQDRIVDIARRIREHTEDSIRSLESRRFR